MRFLDITVPPLRRGARAADPRRVEPYRSLLGTGDAASIEALHAAAFTGLRPLQRRRLYAVLTRTARPADRPWSDDPDELALGVLAVERRQPGAAAAALDEAGLLEAVADLVRPRRPDAADGALAS